MPLIEEVAAWLFVGLDMDEEMLVARPAESPESGREWLDAWLVRQRGRNEFASDKEELE